MEFIVVGLVSVAAFAAMVAVPVIIIGQIPTRPNPNHRW